MNRYVSQLLIVIILLTTALSHLANAEKSSLSDKITQNIKDVCLKPSDKGKYWDIGLKAGGETNVKLKFLGKASAAASFNQGQWEGVQKVLQNQQAHDNASYRDCVKKLTPLFLNKFVPSKPSARIINNNKTNDNNIIVKKYSLLVKSLIPILIYDSDTKQLLKLIFIVDAVNSADYDLYPHEILMTGNIDQRGGGLIQLGKSKPKLALEVVGIGEAPSLLKAHSNGNLRYDLLDFTQKKGQVFDGYIGDSSKPETVKFATSNPSIDYIINKNKNGEPELVSDFKTGAIKLAIDTGEDKIPVMPEVIMKLAVLSNKQLVDTTFMAVFIKEYH